jgi:hypothetical protein
LEHYKKLFNGIVVGAGKLDREFLKDDQFED